MSVKTAGLLMGSIVAMTLAMAGEAFARSARSIPDREYVQVSPDGHLQLDGQRIRFWGWIGHFDLEGKLSENWVKPGDSQADRIRKVEKARRVFDALAQRIQDLGFNMVRWWGIGDWTNPDYEVGDGSHADMAAFSLHALEKRGIKVWMTAFNDFGAAAPEDASLVRDSTTADAWTAAIRAMGDTSPRNGDVGAWDPRMRLVHHRRMKQLADWPNKYKRGLRLGDDPQMAVWELTNEEWMFSHMVNGQWQKLPKFFKDELQQEWIAFLAKKYGADDALSKSWMFLLPGESIKRGTVILAPLASKVEGKHFNDANPAAIAALTATKQAFTREDFTRQRGADVIEFIVDLIVRYKTDRRDYAKSLGKSLKLCPMVLDTGDGFRIQAVNLHQYGDASTMCSYMWQVAADRQQPHFPFVSGLEEPPRLAMGIPWVEVGRVPGKPFFVYEFQTNNPDKYRAEIPYRIAALGAIQDWDIVCWHLFGRANDPDEPEPYSKTMNYSYHGNSIEGVHYKNDEIESSALKAAGTMFINGALDPVRNPTVMTFGRKSLYAPESADYGKSFGDLGPKVAPTTWRYGLQMRVDASQEEDSVEGKVVERGLNEACPITPTDQIQFDWQKGFVKFDAPSAIGWTGFFAQHGGPVEFRNGIVLDGVTVENPPKMPYPVGEDELYISFAAVAEDAKPLAQSRSVVLSLMSTSFNNGFKLNHDNVARGDLGYTSKPFEGMTRGQPGPGEPPVLTARVGATLQCKALDRMRYELKDWHFKTIKRGVVRGGQLVISSSDPVFYVQLTR